MHKSITHFLADESGPTAIEYAVILGGILLAVFATVASIGSVTYDSYNGSKTKMEAAGVK